MSEIDIKAKKIASVIKPILESIRKVSGKDITWGEGGLPPLSQVDAILAGGNKDLEQQLRSYYSCLSNLRNLSANKIKWGKGDIPELEYMDSTLAGLYSFISEYVLKYEQDEE